jgi:hypothetical protein
MRTERKARRVRVNAPRFNDDLILVELFKRSKSKAVVPTSTRQELVELKLGLVCRQVV